MFKLAFRNLFRRKTRTALTLAVIVFGVVGVILSGGFVEDIFVQLREFTIHSRLGHLQVYRSGYYEHGRRQPYEYMIEAPERMARQAQNIPGVTDVMQRLNFSGLLGTGPADLSIMGEGVEPDREARLGSMLQILDGRQLADEDEYGILVGEGVAGSLGLSVGDYVTLLVNTVDGAMNSLEYQVVGVFRSFSQDFDARAIRVSLASAQELLDSTAVHSLVFSLETTEDTERVARVMRERLAGAGFEIKTWLELDDFYPKTVALYQRQFGVFQLIILGMVLLSVANSVNMTAFERVGEFGTLRALGHRGRDVARLLMVENVILGVTGAVLGVAGGIALAWGISRLGIQMPPPPNSSTGYVAQIRIVPVTVFMAFTIGLMATISSTILPARRVANIPVVDALRENI